jgi:HK97 family phage major capsid protein
MSATAVPTDAVARGDGTRGDPTSRILASLERVSTGLEAQGKEIADLKQKAVTPVYPGGWSPAALFGQPPHATTGEVGQDSRPYSIMKAMGYTKGYIPADQCKVEIDLSNRLYKMFGRDGYRPVYNGSLLVPFGAEFMPVPESTEDERLVNECRYRMKAHSMTGFDPGAAAWAYQKAGLGGYHADRMKAFGTVSDAAGGTLVGFPTLGELIDLQRNMEVFSRAGANNISMPANARLQFPKWTSGTTAYWVGEAATITSSDPGTGYLDLLGKKLAILTKVNNELFRYVTPSVESMLRADMAAQGALKADLSMLEGTGGTQIKGLINYPTASSWSQNVDSLLTYTVTSNVFQPEDVYGMQGKLPDVVQGKDLKFVMRNDLWGFVRGRRADAAEAADAKGPFVFNITRTVDANIPNQLDGYPVITSSQVSNTRSSTKTYVLLGHFPDWIVARFGAVEFLASNTGDTPLQNDQTWLRSIQILDAGPRHSASFVFADDVNIA